MRVQLRKYVTLSSALKAKTNEDLVKALRPVCAEIPTGTGKRLPLLPHCVLMPLPPRQMPLLPLVVAAASC